MKIAIDVCIGKRGVKLLEGAGHQIIVEAESGEMDRVWFERAPREGVDLVVSPDSDLEILCYDHAVPFFKVKRGHSGVQTAQRVLSRYPPSTKSS